MGLGILDDKVLSQVPGTTQYFDDPERPQYATASGDRRGLKYDASGPVPIILIPQPSDDPNDPLNWPLWRRDLITLILSVTAVFATSLGPILAANTVTLSVAWFIMPFDKIAELTGYFLLGTGFAAFFCVPTSRVWGKRHQFVIGTAALVAFSAWNGAVGKNYTSMAWSRIFQGAAVAPFEALLSATIGDLYHVHQRGIRMACTTLAVFGGAFFTPIVVGKITHTIMWWWTFNLVAIFCAVCLPFVFLFCPETAFRRDPALNIDLLDVDTGKWLVSRSADDPEAEKVVAGTPPEHFSFSNNNNNNNNNNNQDPATQSLAAPSNPATASREELNTTLLQSLALFNGRKTDEHWWKLLFRPLPLFLHPAFLWACMIQGLMIGWTVFIGVLMASFMIGPPLWWDEVKTGYAYTAPFLGAIVGFAIVGALSDWSARFLTRLNRGVYEPEFRIVLVIPQLILGAAGLYGWGITVDGMLHQKYSVYVPLVFFGLEVSGMVVGAVASSLYIVDAYRDLSIEGFTCMIMFKNFFGFALTFKAYGWLLEHSTRSAPLFDILGSVTVAVCLTSLPMYIFGKRIRSFYHRHDILTAFKLR